MEFNIKTNIETNLGKFKYWSELSIHTTNIILSNYDLQLYALPSFITKFEKLENITFADYNFDKNKIKFNESFKIIKNLLKNKNIKINNCDFNIFLGDYYRNNKINNNKAKNYYLVNHKTDINAASKIMQYYSKYYSSECSKIVYELLNTLDKNLYHTVYFVSLKFLHLIKIPLNIGYLSNLYSLDLSWNNLTELSDCFSYLNNLQLLYLNDNYLEKLPDSIGSLNNLKILELYNNNLKELPDSITTLGKLQKLNLNGNKLINLPINIGSLINLKSLDLYNNDLAELPASIQYLKNLQSIDLNDNCLTKLPDWISFLSNLQLLEISWNKLTELPNTFYKISNKCYILTDSQILLNNLPNNLKHLCIKELDLALVNLPCSLIELKIKSYRQIKTKNIKLHHGCTLIIEK